ncbi:MAG: hypothetical protein M1517_09645 [Deltaproteobacteria bacterium]|nr:hypothetical protein [Deltaproteobacteria bacterium]
MMKRLFVIVLVLGLVPANVVAGFMEDPAGQVTGTSVKRPVGVKINTGYLATKMADPGWRFVDSYNWLNSWYIEGTYTVYRNLDVFGNYGYSDYSGSGNSISTDFTSHQVTFGARYSYPLWRFTVPYVELGIGSYFVSFDVSAPGQSIGKHDIVVAPEAAVGFYIPLKVPTDTSTTGVNIQCSFGLIRSYFIEPLRFDFGYLGDIDIDGQRLVIGLGMSF